MRYQCVKRGMIVIGLAAVTAMIVYSQKSVGNGLNVIIESTGDPSVSENDIVEDSVAVGC